MAFAILPVAQAGGDVPQVDARGGLAAGPGLDGRAGALATRWRGFDGCLRRGGGPGFRAGSRGGSAGGAWGARIAVSYSVGGGLAGPVGWWQAERSKYNRCGPVFTVAVL